VLATLLAVLTYLPGRDRALVAVFSAFGIVTALAELLSVAGVATLVTVLSGPTEFVEHRNVGAIKYLGLDLRTFTPIQLITGIGIFAGLAVAVKNILRAVFNYCSSLFAISVDRSIGRQLIENLLAKGYVWFSQKNTSDLRLYVSWRSYFGSVALTAVMNIVVEAMFILCVVAMLLLSAPLVSGFVVVFIGSIAVTFYYWNAKRLYEIAKLDRFYKVGIGRVLMTIFQGGKDVLMFGQERSFTNEFADLANGQTKAKAKQVFYTSLPSQMLETVGILALVLAIIAMLHLSAMSRTEILALIALIAVAAWRTLPALSKLLNSVAQLRSALPYIDTVSQHLHERSRSEHPTNLSPAKALAEDFETVRLEDIGFHYDLANHRVLSECNLTISRGDAIGIIGPSGAGKSTLVDLVAGLIVPTEGRFLVNEIPLLTGQQHQWRHQIGYVGQAPYITDDTLERNIAFGVPGERIDQDRVRSCCERAAIRFWESLPDGLQTCIGERGAKLSGGQQQRIAIARALYAGAKILIFDEATSALDHETENEIRQTIFSLKGHFTLLIVAHRLGSLEDCDNIFWLDNGTIVDHGPSTELLPRYESWMRRATCSERYT